MSKTSPSVLVLGGGHMGGALARRWQAAGFTVQVVEADAGRRAELTHAGITTHASMDPAGGYDALVLAIKPQQFAGIAGGLSTCIGDATLLSIMAGTNHAALSAVTPNAVRTMPNLPAQIGEAMTVGYTHDLSAERRALTEQLFAAAGQFAWVEEEALLHAVTAISGSGPAYLFAFMEALSAAAIAEGLNPELARTLVTQTMLGAALLADQSVADAGTLRRNVTSPGGTTEAALAVLSRTLPDSVAEAVHAALERSKDLARH